MRRDERCAGGMEMDDHHRGGEAERLQRPDRSGFGSTSRHIPDHLRIGSENGLLHSVWSSGGEPVERIMLRQVRTAIARPIRRPRTPSSRGAALRVSPKIPCRVVKRTSIAARA